MQMNRFTKNSMLSLALLSLGVSFPPMNPAFAAEKAVLTSAVSATETVAFDLYLPLQHRDQLETDLQGMHDAGSSKYHRWLTEAEFEKKYGATDAQVKAITDQLASYGLMATRVTSERIHVTGPASSVEQALGTVLKHGVYRNGKTTIAAEQGVVKVGAMKEMNVVVTGLSGHIWVRPHSHRMATPDNRYSTTGGYFFDDLKQAYSFPSYAAYTGKGVTIGILMDGDFYAPDMATYFGHEKLVVPSFKTINVDGGAPFTPNGDSFETHLDLQQSGGMAPQAKILLYNIPDLSDGSIIDGLSEILKENKADVVSMSFGGPELFYTAAYNAGTDFTYLLQEEDDLMAKGNAMGITFVASSGDSGALSAVPLVCFNYGPKCGTAVASANFPASSPHVTGVGGTNLLTTYSTTNLNSKYVSEEAYADPLTEDIFYGTSATGSYWGSGGGDSILFSRPLFQSTTNTGSAKFRTVPDLAMHMGGCPADATCNVDDSYDWEVIAGEYEGVIGTSAAAPDFAGLTALDIERQGGRLGNENYTMYTLALLQNIGLPIHVFKTGIPGFNGLYSTTAKGYNRVLGNGTLNGVDFLLAPFTPVAGTPQTPSNP
jgi:kumamolisin